MAAIAPVLVSSIGDPANYIQTTTSATVANDATLNPEGISPQGVAKWVNRAGGIPIGYPTLTMSLRPPTKASRISKVTVKLVVPTLEQTSPSTATGIQPAPTKAYDCTFIGEFMLPERSTLAERKALFHQVFSLFVTTIQASDGSPSVAAASPLRTAIENLENVY